MKENWKSVNKILYRRLKFIGQPVRNYVRDHGFKQRVKYTKLLEKSKIRNNVILYEAYHGKSMTGNPYAIFKRLLQHPDFKNYQHIWAIEDEKSILKKYRNQSNVKFIKIYSDEYLNYLTEAKFLINNTSFPYYFQKREGQTYVNTWHGTPLKTLGKDIRDAGFADHKNIQRNLLHTDYLISPNQFTSNKLLESNDVHTLFSGKIADIGYPRVDSMLQADKNEIRKILSIPSDKTIILFAPTYRGKVNQEADTSEKLFSELEEIKKGIGSDSIVLLKTHYFAYKFFEDNGLADICIPDWLDTNELLSIIDILITDYSSIFFDFLPSKRPIIFYGDDYEYYKEERGFYLDKSELPGPFCTTTNEVIQYVKQMPEVMETYKERYQHFIDTYCYNDDGKATERFIDIVLKGKSSDRVIQRENHKTKILLYCGGFYHNGITMSAINLLNSLDYSQYEVAVIESSEHRDGKEQNINKINPNVSILYRAGQWNASISEWYKHQLILRRGLYTKSITRYVPEKMYKRELDRLLGNTRFDIVIDFGGYNPFWSLLFAFGPFKKKCIFLHAIVMKEYDKVVNGELKHRKSLKVIISLYRYFHKVISVSKSANEENTKDLYSYIEGNIEKMVYVNNIINHNRILTMKAEKKLLKYEDQEYLILSEDKSSNDIVNIKGIKIPSHENINFVNVARLSPEKAHVILIQAFSKVVNIEKKSRLYIAGEGPLEEELKRLVKSLKIEDNVFFTGQIDNPYVLIDQCDCFVLSSEYEGQGLVLLEALVLQKPIIATNVTGIKSVLVGGLGKLVEHDVEALKEAMLSFITKGMETKAFDFEAYNKEAIETFYQEID